MLMPQFTLNVIEIGATVRAIIGPMPDDGAEPREVSVQGIIDTEADWTFIDTSVVAQLGLKPIEMRTVNTLSSGAKPILANAYRIRIRIPAITNEPSYCCEVTAVGSDLLHPLPFRQRASSNVRTGCTRAKAVDKDGTMTNDQIEKLAAPAKPGKSRYDGQRFNGATKQRQQARELKSIRRAIRKLIQDLKAAEDTPSKRLYFEILDRERDRLEGKPYTSPGPAKVPNPDDPRITEATRQLILHDVPKATATPEPIVVEPEPR